MKRGVIKLKGRLKNAQLDYNTKHPILLPKRNYIRVKHSGLKDTLNEIRSSYWIIQGRNDIKAVLKSCTLCRYFESKTFKKLPSAPLPIFQVQYSYPFTYTGVGYLGPLFVRHTLGKDKSELFKVLVAFYTCASSRAIHLDIVPDISSEAFGRSLKRFISRPHT